MHRLAVTLLLALLVASAAPVRAETVLFACSESCPLALFEALELELRGHGAFLVSRLSPAGFSVEAHESDARRMAALTPAAAVLWIERASPMRVRVLSPRQQGVHEAPLTSAPEEIAPRVFAAIAGDVVLQALSAPEQPAVPASNAGPAKATQENATATVPAFTMPEGKTAKPSRPTRFFLRFGAALGFAFVKPGLAADRAPTKEYVQEAYATQIQQNSVEAGRETLAAHGWDCDWSARSSGVMLAANCKVGVNTRGAVFVPGFDLQAGWHFTPRFALAAFVRFTPKAGEGLLKHAVLGAQAEYALIAQQPVGFWLNLGFGMGGGQIQARPSFGSSGPKPYVKSGLGEAHALIALGYRFLPNIGVYAVPTVRVFFPESLWVIDPMIGLEARI